MKISKTKLDKFINICKINDIAKLKIYIINQQVVKQYTNGVLYKVILSDDIDSIYKNYLKKDIIYIIDNESNLLEKYICIINEIKKNKKMKIDYNYYLGDITDLLNICKMYTNIPIIIDKQITKKTELKEVTKNGHKAILNILKKIIDIENIDIESLKVINNLDKKDSTKKNYITALISYYRSKEDNKYKNIIELLVNEMNKYSQKIDIIIKNNTKTETQKENFSSWSRVLDINNRLNELGKTNDKIQYYNIILSLYTKMCPRRIADYSNLYYIETPPVDSDNQILYVDNNKICKNVGKNKYEHIGEKNYFGKYKDMYVFVFNNYKTNYSYKKQILEVDKDLANMIVEYIAKNNIKYEQNIFNLSDNKLKYTLQNIFKTYENKKISASMLRHIYLSDNISNQSIWEKEFIGLKMGHSIDMQTKYIKYDKENVKESIELDISREGKLLGKNGSRKKKYNTKEEYIAARKINTTNYRLNKKNKNIK